MSSHAPDRASSLFSITQNPDEPTEPTPVESDFHGEAFAAHTAPQEDQLTVEEEMIILLMHPLIPGPSPWPIFATLGKCRKLYWNRSSPAIRPGVRCLPSSKKQGTCALASTSPRLRLSLPGKRNVQSWTACRAPE
ncbi:hypothetical protein N7522_010657 [Penicillium canescens]|nr:hypothetical protein N7522_010657 [Penicillium canescens]